jgi:hypothetical protein
MDQPTDVPCRQLALDQDQCGFRPGLHLQQWSDRRGPAGPIERRHPGAKTSDDLGKKAREANVVFETIDQNRMIEANCH